MKVNENSIRWAIEHLHKLDDTDLFPRPFELDILKEIEDEVVTILKNIDLGNYKFGSSRRFIVPKDDLAYRIATQLDPLDSLFLTAILHQFGQQIEDKRIKISERKVFSYRFAPNSTHLLYSPTTSWIEFWQECLDRCSAYNYIVTLDIADFYNQIYHHIIENQLLSSGIPNQAKNWVLGLLQSTTAKVSRGIPVGPHATHLLGELSLIPIDNSLSIKGINYCRYVDDIVIFCKTYDEARIAIYQIAEILDKQQRLILQRNKTKIFRVDEFSVHCSNMIRDRPISKDEEALLDIIRKHTSGDLYTPISVSDLTDSEVKVFTEDLVSRLISTYINSIDPNYARLRWLFRRLSQIGLPIVIHYSLQNLDKLMPAIGDVCRYFLAVAGKYPSNMYMLGTLVLQALDDPLIKSNEYFQLTLLNLFSKNAAPEHMGKLISLYRNSSPSLRRKIILSACQSDAGDWIRELKEDFNGLDIWSKRAFIIATRTLPAEERKFYLEHIRNGDILNELLIKWAKKN